MDPILADTFSALDPLKDTTTFLTMVVAIFGLVGALSRSMMVASWTSFAAYSIITLETGHGLFQTLMFVMIALVSIVVAGQVWSVAFGGD